MRDGIHWCIDSDGLVSQTEIMSGKVKFNEEKAVQVTAELLRLDCRTEIDKLRLVKLLYLVDRESFTERARPVIGGSYYSMPHGTVISEALDAMSFGDEGEWATWGRFFQAKDAWTIAMVAQPTTDLISPREHRIIERVHALFGKMTPKEIRDFTHTLPEYEDPDRSSIPIPLERLIEAVGRSKEDAQRIADECGSIDFLSRIR
jgi:uncharacterized phage-associated protein